VLGLVFGLLSQLLFKNRKFVSRECEVKNFSAPEGSRSGIHRLEVKVTPKRNHRKGHTVKNQRGNKPTHTNDLGDHLVYKMVSGGLAPG